MMHSADTPRHLSDIRTMEDARALARQIIHSRSQEPSRGASASEGERSLPKAPSESGREDRKSLQTSHGMRLPSTLGDVRTLEEARALAKQIVSSKGFDANALLELAGASGQAPPHDAPPGTPQSAMVDAIVRKAVQTLADNDIPPRSMHTSEAHQHHHHQHHHQQQQQHQQQHQHQQQPPRSSLGLDDSLPETPGLEGGPGIGQKDISTLLNAVQQAVMDQAMSHQPTRTPSCTGQQQHSPSPYPPHSSTPLPQSTPPPPPPPPQPSMSQQQQQLLLHLQRQLAQQQQQQSRSTSPRRLPHIPSPSPAPRDTYDSPAPAVFGPSSYPMGSMSNDVFNTPQRQTLSSPTRRLSPALPLAPLQPLSDRGMARPPPLPPAPYTTTATKPSRPPSSPYQEDVRRETLGHHLSATSNVSESADELEAREQAHRIMVDFIAQKNLTNLLTEKLAEKTKEADELRARLASGEGREGLMHLAENLHKYERELGQERARTLALEHEIHQLRSDFEKQGLPLPKAKAEYEHEISLLRRQIEEQDRQISTIRQQTEHEKEMLLQNAEGKWVRASQQTHEELQREIDLLRAKLKEKRCVNQELQDMLKLHLKYNAELRTRSHLNHPQWIHPLLKEPQPTLSELRDPASGIPPLPPSLGLGDPPVEL